MLGFNYLKTSQLGTYFALAVFICILETLKIFNCNSDVHFIIDFSGYLTLGAQF